MNTKILKYLLLGLSMTTFIACNSENEEDILPEDPDEVMCQDNTATLSGAVTTIINANCAVPGCHVSGTNKPDFTQKANIIQLASKIRQYTQNGIMPPPASGRTLNDQQKLNIFCWVENGAQDN